MLRYLNKTILETLKVLPYAVSLLFLTVFLITGTVHAQEAEVQNPVLDTTPLSQPETFNAPPVDPNILDLSRPVITGRVAEEKFLPPELYGTWQVNQTLITTNAPYRFRKKTSDIWILQQIGQKIRLYNPDTRAQSIITVNMVHENTATFTCSLTNGNKVEAEQPTIKVIKDEFFGKNIYQIRYYDGEKVILIEKALFEIYAKKLSGPTPRIFVGGRSHY